MSVMPEQQIKQLTGMTDVPASDWDRLAGVTNPFTRHGFLSAMETSGSVCRATGWEPCHLTVSEGEQLAAALPLYRKHHSFGEFVFDWAWADACARAGIAYYPKLLTAAPFSPVTGHRLLGNAPDRLVSAAKDLAERSGHVSWHVLFPATVELPVLKDAGLLLRKDCQFQWFDRGHGDFEGFLAAMTSKRRKEIRRERRKVAEAGIHFREVTGYCLDEETLANVYRCYADTYHVRGQAPYLTPAFFRELSHRQPESLLMFIASLKGRDIAVAICLRDETTLYGRYWGSLVDVPGLHFEACYYQGIDYCLRHGLTRFEPGTQGEHKISRGFEPVPVWSAHWFRHPSLRQAVADFLDRETPMVDRYLKSAASLLPFRKGD